MARRKKNSAVSALVGLARAGKDATTIKNQKSSKKEKQAAKKRLNAYSSGNRSVYVPKQARPQNRQTSIQQRNQHKRPAQRQGTVKKPEKTGFEKLIDRANANIRSRGMKTTSRMEAYKQKNTAKAHQMQAYKSKQQAVQQKKAAEEAKRSTRAQILSSYDKAMKGPYSNTTRKSLIEEKKKATKGFDTIYENEQAKAATKELDKRLTQMGAKGLAAQQKEVRESRKQIAKEAKRQQRLDKTNAPKQMTTDEALRMQWASRNPTYRTQKGGDKVITKDLQEKIAHNIQGEYDRGSAGMGFMSGSMPVADLKQSVEKKYGIKLDDSKAKESLSYQIGEAAGYLAKSAAFGGASEGAISKALTKTIAKKTGKQVTSKAAKFGINRVSEALASAPVNIEDAAKNSKDVKEFGKNLAVNAALDAGLGSAVDGVKAVSRGVKYSKKTNLHTAIQKTAKGQPLTQQEAKVLEKVKVRAEKKRQQGAALNTEERLVNKASSRGQEVIQGRKADQAFSQQVDKALKGELKPSEELVIGKTPQKLQEHGASDINMTMKQSTVKKTAYPAGYLDALKGVETRKTQGHNLGIGTVKQIRKDLENPVAILKSDTQRESFVVFTRRVDQQGNPIMVALHLDKNGKIGVSNEVASAYGKDNYMNFITAQREKGNVLYENKKTGLDSLPGNGLQLPELGDTSDPINTLYQNGGKVNKKEAPQLPNSTYSEIDLISTSNAGVGPEPTAKGAKPSLLNKSIPDSQAKDNPESLKIGDTVDDITIEHMNKQESPVTADLDHDPNVQKILERNSSGSSKAAEKPSSFRQKITQLKDTTAQKFVDSLQGIETMGRKMKNEAGEALIVQASSLRRAGEKAAFNINNKQTDFNGQIVGDGLLEILSPVMKQKELVYDDFNDYLFHQLNIDRFKNNKSLWGDDAVLPEVSERLVKELEEQYPNFKETAEKIYQYCRNQNDIRVQSGLITQGKQDLMQSLYEHYVPAYRKVNQKAADLVEGEFRVHTGIRTAKGGKQEILPIHEQLINATQKTWESAELNETIRQLAKAQGLEKSQIAKEIIQQADSEKALEDMLNRTNFFEVDGNTAIVRYFEKGEPRETRVSKLVYDGLKEWAPADKHIMLDTGAFDKLLTGVEELASGFNKTIPGKGLIHINNAFKALITSYNPFFLIRNGLKDMQDIPVNSSSLSGFIANMPKAFRSMSAKDDWWQTYLATGARYSGIIDPEKALKPQKKIGKFVMKPLDLLEKANMAVESYPRYTEFLNILQQQGVTDIKQATRAQIEKAAKGASDVTCDFGRAGSLVKPFNRSSVPFLNASIQGFDKLLRVLSGQKGFEGYASLFTKLTVLGAAPAIAQELIYANDPDYQQLNARDRAGNYFIKNADGTFWKIPRGRSISTLTNPIQQTARALTGNDGMSFDEFAQKLVTDVAPVNPKDSFILMQCINTYANDFVKIS